MAQLTPVPSAERIADTVYQRLRDAMFSGELAPGSRLSVPRLASQLGVSRGPVREAVQKLVQERLAHEEQHRGAMVATIGLQELVVMYEVREVLEGLAARLAIERGGPDVVEGLDAALAEHERAVKASDLGLGLAADMRFHGLLRNASGNRELIRQLDDIQTRVQLAMRTTSVTAGMDRALEDHRAIRDAVRAGDADAAEDRARAHISRLRGALAGETRTSEVLRASAR